MRATAYRLLGWATWKLFLRPRLRSALRLVPAVLAGAGALAIAALLLRRGGS